MINVCLVDYLCNTHYIIVTLQALALAQKLKAVWHLNRREVSVKRIFLYKHSRDVFWGFLLLYFSKPVRELRRGILYERSTWLCNSLASYASLLFWRPPVSGLIEMFLQRRAVAALCEPAIETVLEIRVSILGKPVALCRANEQEEDGVRNQSETSVNRRRHAEKKRTNAIRLFLSPARTV